MLNYIKKYVFYVLVFLISCANMSKAMEEELVDIYTKLRTIQPCSRPDSPKIFCTSYNRFLCAAHDETEFNILQKRIEKIKRTRYPFTEFEKKDDK